MKQYLPNYSSTLPSTSSGSNESSNNPSSRLPPLLSPSTYLATEQSSKKGRGRPKLSATEIEEREKKNADVKEKKTEEQKKKVEEKKNKRSRRALVAGALSQ